MKPTNQTQHELWEIQVYLSGELVETEVVEPDYLAVTMERIQAQGFEVRAEACSATTRHRSGSYRTQPSWPTSVLSVAEPNEAEGLDCSTRTYYPASKEADANPHLSESERSMLQKALGILEARMIREPALTSPLAVKQLCRLQIAHERDEVFCCLFLTSQHQLIGFERLFNGTIDGAVVYPRTVVRRCLELNASAVIFAHNHPSGVCKPSGADLAITKRLQEALRLFDINVLDHIITGLEDACSMAEQGMM